MVINENTVLINTFGKGMNSDVSLLMIPDGQYIYAENLRITGLTPTNGTSVMNGVGEIRPIEGTKWSSSGINIDRVLAVDSIRNIGVVVYVDSADNNWKVAIFENKIDNDIHKDDNPDVMPMLYTIFDSEESTNAIKFSTVMHYETEDITKLYIADGVNPIKLLLLEKEDGQWKDIDKDEVDSYPKVIFNPPVFEGLISGSLKSGSVLYAYRLYKKYGIATDMSPTTKLIPIVNHNNGDLYEGLEPNKVSNAGVEISIEVEAEYQLIFDKMQVYRIMYIENGQLPTIELIYDNDIVQNVYDTGQDSLAVMTLEEFNSISGIHIIPKVIESKNDYLFAAQIKDALSEAFSGVNVTAEYEIVSAEGDTDYSNVLYAYSYKSLRRGETYRYGIVLYDERGNSSGAIHLADITVDDDVIWQYDSQNGLELKKPLGVKFTLHGIPENCKSYEIVRCRRTYDHMKTISSGVLARPIKRYNSDGTTFPYTPTGFLTLQKFKYTGNHGYDHNGHYGRPVPDGTHTVHADNFDDLTLYQFVSPEVCYAKDQFLQMTKDINFKLKQKAICYDKDGSLLSNSGEDSNEHPYDYLTGRGGLTKLSVHTTYYQSPNQSLFDTIDSLAINARNYVTTFYAYENITLPGSGNIALHTWRYYDPITDLYFTDHSKNVSTVKKYSSTYIDLYGIDTSNIDDTAIDILKISLANELSWNDVLDKPQNNVNVVVNKYENFLQNVGDQLYNNVIIGGYYGSVIGLQSGDSVSNDGITINTGENEYDLNRDDRLFCAVGGRCALLLLQHSLQHEDYQGQKYVYTELCDILKTPKPYSDDITLDTYYSYGDYFKSDEAEPVVFDGDTYINTMEYVSMHKMYFGLAYDTVASHAVIYSIPVESSINLAYTCGDEFSKDYNGTIKTNLQIEPSSVYNVYVQDEPLYVYNNAYSEDTPAKVFAARDEEDSNAQKNIDYRVYYSMLKENGEYIDSWLKYQPANYIDVDSKHGEITHMRNFHNKLFFWQEDATGILSVNERVQITDLSNMPLILGTGGVLERYDYLDNVSGMYKEHFCDTMSEHALYWFDDAHLEIKQYADGGGISSLTKQCGVSNIMRSKSDTLVVPWMFYDNTYQEVITKFNRDYSIAYNEAIKAFTSLYSVSFDGAVQFTNGAYLMASERNKIGQWNVPGNELPTKLEYVVNKQPVSTKVFDNQEVVMNWRKEMLDRDSYLSTYHTWLWKTDLNYTGRVENLETTIREGNYRFAVPREEDADYGKRMRGKYMVCTIEDTNPKMDAGISYIMTKFRTSWS